MAGAAGRLGWFEAPSTPPPGTGLRLPPTDTAAGLLRSVLIATLRWTLPGALLLAAGHAATSLVAVAVGRFVDTVAGPLAAGAGLGKVRGELAAGLALVAALYLVINVGMRFGGRLGWIGVQRAQHALSLRVLAGVLDEDVARLRPPGAWLSLVTADVRRACLVLYVAVYPPAEAVGIVVAVAVLWGLHPALGAAVLAGLLVVFLATHLLARPLRARAATHLVGLSDAAGITGDLLAGHRTLRGLHAVAEADARHRRVSRRALDATLAVRRAEAAYDGCVTGIGQLLSGAVLIVALVLTVRGELALGALVTAAGVAVAIASPVVGITGTMGGRWAAALGAAGRLLEAQDEVSGAARGPHEGLPEEIARETGGGLRVLPSGVDVRPSSGTLPDGRSYLVAPHEPGLLAGSVLDNVMAARDVPVTNDVARAALDAACLPEDELRDGYATEAGEGGASLSGGQRQRVALARSLAAGTDVLVLVRPTTSVDSVTELRVAAGVERLRRGLSTVVVGDSPAFRAVAGMDGVR